MTTMDIGAWLRGLGLERYERAFRDNEIDPRVLPELTPDDLKELGVTAIGHRRLLIKAIADLATDAGRPADGAQPAAAVSAMGEAERRHLTVMFCDLVGSTPLSSRFDPEDLRDILAGYQSAVAATVARLGGFIAKYMGDGVLVYFGYPQAYEHDAERAVRCGLAVAEAVAKLDVGVPLETRIGIATGLVVVGDMIGEGDSQERGVVGETQIWRLVCKRLLRPAQLSSEIRPAASLAGCSIWKISVLDHSLASLSRSVPGWCAARAPWSAGSRRCGPARRRW
jgi:class 3 adenylate cyclase